jgi:PAS domain S-box-containing protein
MLGWQLKEIKGGDLHEIVPVTDESGNRVLKDNRPMHVALTTGTDTTTSSIGTATYFYARKDDTRFPVRIAVTPIILGGKIIGAIDNFQDITEERNFAATLAEAKARDEALLASIGDGMIATDRAGIITTVNHAAEVLLRCVGKDFLGKKLHEIVAVYDEKGVPPPPEKRPIQIALTTGKTTMTTCFYERKDGTRLHVALTVAPVLLGNNIVGAINIFQDVAKK